MKSREDRIVDNGMTIVILLLMIFGAYVNWPEIQAWSRLEIVYIQSGYRVPATTPIKQHRHRSHVDTLYQGDQRQSVVGP